MAFVRFRILSRVFVIYTKRIHNTVGINSDLKDGKHCILFDFDASDFHTVKKELEFVQTKYDLANIHIASTGKEGHFHAYCLQRVELNEAIAICLDCPSIDSTFIQFALHRKHFTLRIASKNKRKISTIWTLKGYRPETVKVSELTHATIYETGSA